MRPPSCFAVWLHSNAHDTTRAFWKVQASAGSRKRLKALVGAANRVVGKGLEFQVQTWDAARRITAQAIFDNQLSEFYSVEDRKGTGLSDATVLDYWNYTNDPRLRRVPREGPSRRERDGRRVCGPAGGSPPGPTPRVVNVFGNLRCDPAHARVVRTPVLKEAH